MIFFFALMVLRTLSPSKIPQISFFMFSVSLGVVSVLATVISVESYVDVEVL